MFTNSIRTIAVRVLGHSSVSRACFSAAAIRCKKVARRKPVHRTASGAVHDQKSFLSEDSFPPTSFLRSAALSGAINLSPEEALNLLRRYISLAKSLKRNWEQEVCTGANTSPETLTILAKILGRSPGVGQSRLGNHVLRTASKLGDPQATIDLVSSAMRQKALQDPTMAGPLQQLEHLAQYGSNATAMVLQAMLLERRNMTDSALKLYEIASSMVFEPTLFTENIEGISKAWVGKGHIYLQKNDHENALKAFQAATILDDPQGYYYFGKLLKDGSTTQEVSFMKAAASGHLEVCEDLASLYLKRDMETAGAGTLTGNENGKETLEATKENRQNAREWFELAAAEGSGASMIFMAEFCKDEGKMNEAEDWLDKARKADAADEFVVSRAKELKASWANI